MRFELPMPPSTNKLFATVGKKRIKTRNYRLWIEEAGWLINAQRTEAGAIGEPVNVSLRAPRQNKRHDIDNTIKPSLDLLVRMNVLVDDSIVQRVTAEWVSDSEPFTVTVEAA